MAAADNAPGVAGVEAFGYRQELNRSLGLFDLLVYGLLFIVPIAPMAVFGFVFNAGHGMVPLVYLIGAVAMVFTALSYMSMAHAFPIAGSLYSYASRSLGATVGFFAGWAILLDYLLLPTLNYVAVAIALHSAFPQVSKPVCVSVLLAFATAINYFGIETTARVNRGVARRRIDHPGGVHRGCALKAGPSRGRSAFLVVAALQSRRIVAPRHFRRAVAGGAEFPWLRRHIHTFGRGPGRLERGCESDHALAPAGHDIVHGADMARFVVRAGPHAIPGRRCHGHRLL
jgi:hypothetical protein